MEVEQMLPAAAAPAPEPEAGVQPNQHEERLPTHSRRTALLGSEQQRRGRVVRLDEVSDLPCPDDACTRRRTPCSTFPVARMHRLQAFVPEPQPR